MRRIKLFVVMLVACGFGACKKDSPPTVLPRLISFTSIGTNTSAKTEFYYNSDGSLFQTRQSINGISEAFTEYYYESGKVETAKTFWGISGDAPKLRAETDFKYSGSKLVNVEILTLDNSSRPNGGVSYNFSYPDGEIPTANITYPPILRSFHQNPWVSPDRGSMTVEEYPTNSDPEQIPMKECEFDNKSNPLYRQPLISALRFTLGGIEHFAVNFNPQSFFFKNNVTKSTTLVSGIQTIAYKYNKLGLPVSSMWRTNVPVGLKSETVYEYGN